MYYKIHYKLKKKKKTEKKIKRRKYSVELKKKIIVRAVALLINFL